jgi:nucleotide-binding universal stress UspA family protein
MLTISPTRCTVFDRIVCAVDGSQSSLDAVRQARVLRSEPGELELDAVFEPRIVGYSPYGSPLIISEAQKAAAAKLAEAQSACPDAASHLLQGPTVRRLLERLTEYKATLVAVGATSRNRGVGIIRGSVTTAMLHRAPASVLVARTPAVAAAFPHAVVVGYDGSPSADRALATGLHVADRYSARLRVVVAGATSANAYAALADLAVARDERDPVEALLAVSHEADLLIVGSRGLHGVRALGSVSERVGHQAACSVLVVR